MLVTSPGTLSCKRQGNSSLMKLIDIRWGDPADYYNVLLP